MSKIIKSKKVSEVEILFIEDTLSDNSKVYNIIVRVHNYVKTKGWTECELSYRNFEDSEKSFQSFCYALQMSLEFE